MNALLWIPFIVVQIVRGFLSGVTRKPWTDESLEAEFAGAIEGDARHFRAGNSGEAA